MAQNTATNESGRRFPSSRPYWSTFRHEPSGTVYRQTEYPTGGIWIEIAEETIPNLSQLPDVFPAQPTNGQALLFDQLTRKWTPSDLPAPAVDPYEEVFGVLRNTGAGWFLITAGNHAPKNVDSVSNNTTAVIVDFTSLGVLDVGTFMVHADETYEGQYDVGASVTLTQASIQIFERQPKENTTLITHQGGGAFVHSGGLVTSVSYAAGTGILTINHPSTTNNAPRTWNLPSIDAERGTIENSNQSLGAINTKVKFFEPGGAQKNLANPAINRFYFNRDIVTIDPVVVDPNTVTDPAGNIWFYGKFKTS